MLPHAKEVQNHYFEIKDQKNDPLMAHAPITRNFSTYEHASMNPTGQNGGTYQRMSPDEMYKLGESYVIIQKLGLSLGGSLTTADKEKLEHEGIEISEEASLDNLIRFIHKPNLQGTLVVYHPTRDYTLKVFYGEKGGVIKDEIHLYLDHAKKKLFLATEQPEFFEKQDETQDLTVKPADFVFKEDVPPLHSLFDYIPNHELDPSSPPEAQGYTYGKPSIMNNKKYVWAVGGFVVIGLAALLGAFLKRSKRKST